MSEAKSFFENKDFSKDKCERLAKNPEMTLSWENESVSKNSPGIVSNTETLARQIYTPIHIDTATNTLTAAAFNDVFDKGLSVSRLSHISLSDVHIAGELKAENDRSAGKKRVYLGIVEAVAIDIRKVVDSHNNKRIYGVFDTALPEAPCHADVCMIRPAVELDSPLAKKALKKERRRLLQEQFGIMIVNEV